MSVNRNDTPPKAIGTHTYIQEVLKHRGIPQSVKMVLIQLLEKYQTKRDDERPWDFSNASIQDGTGPVRFLAYGGFRRTEAANLTWADCDFVRNKITVRGDPETGTKNNEIREVPMIPDMRQLLERLRAERTDEPVETPVMRVHECQKAMDRAAKVIGMHRITHHDLRPLFATKCIESGVGIPTVSCWLGHKDGGALAMKVYGHLRDQHSVAMAQKVTFSKPQPDKQDAN